MIPLKLKPVQFNAELDLYPMITSPDGSSTLATDGQAPDFYDVILWDRCDSGDKEPIVEIENISCFHFAESLTAYLSAQYCVDGQFMTDL